MHTAHSRLHDRAGEAAATAVIRADATALSALRLDDGTGGRGGGRRHFCEVKDSRRRGARR